MLLLGCRFVYRCRFEKLVQADARTTDRTIAGEAAISIFVETLKIGLIAVFKARSANNCYKGRIT